MAKQRWELVVVSRFACIVARAEVDDDCRWVTTVLQ